MALRFCWNGGQAALALAPHHSGQLPTQFIAKEGSICHGEGVQSGKKRRAPLSFISLEWKPQGGIWVCFSLLLPVILCPSFLISCQRLTSTGETRAPVSDASSVCPQPSLSLGAVSRLYLPAWAPHADLLPPPGRCRRLPSLDAILLQGTRPHGHFIDAGQPSQFKSNVSLNLRLSLQSLNTTSCYNFIVFL